MARLQESFLQRIELFADRVIDVVDTLESRKLSKRMLDQLLAAGTSVGANIFEADEAMSRPDFIKCLCIAVKELNETRFWLRLAGRRAWLKAESLNPFLGECDELRKILGTMISRTKSAVKRTTTTRSNAL